MKKTSTCVKCELGCPADESTVLQEENKRENSGHSPVDPSS